MKAIVQDAYGSPDVLRLADIELPEIGADDVLVRVRAAGVDRGVWHLVTGLPYLVRVAGYGLRRPKTPVPGADFAGRVEAVGANVTRFSAGDEVFGTCAGSFAEYARARADQIARKPDNLTFEQAAALPASALAALQSLRDGARAVGGDEVLVIGAGGGVGAFAVQIAKALDARVTGVCSTRKAEFVRAIGADDVIDYTREDFVGGDRRYDVILDIAGNRSLAHMRRALRPDGRLVIVGGEGGGRWLGGTDRQLRALLLSVFVRQRLRTLVSKSRGEDLQRLGELSGAGRISPPVDRVYPLPAAPDAIRDLEAGRVRGKAVIAL
jgi:NADPH:quinone reductase-like Zn-dependent oxidoreductase